MFASLLAKVAEKEAVSSHSYQPIPVAKTCNIYYTPFSWPFRGFRWLYWKYKLDDASRDHEKATHSLRSGLMMVHSTNEKLHSSVEPHSLLSRHQRDYQMKRCSAIWEMKRRREILLVYWQRNIDAAFRELSTNGVQLYYRTRKKIPISKSCCSLINWSHCALYTAACKSRFGIVILLIGATLALPIMNTTSTVLSTYSFLR